MIAPQWICITFILFILSVCDAGFRIPSPDEVVFTDVLSSVGVSNSRSLYLMYSGSQDSGYEFAHMIEKEIGRTKFKILLLKVIASDRLALFQRLVSPLDSESISLLLEEWLVHQDLYPSFHNSGPYEIIGYIFSHRLVRPELALPVFLAAVAKDWLLVVLFLTNHAEHLEGIDSKIISGILENKMASPSTHMKELFFKSDGFIRLIPEQSVRFAFRESVQRVNLQPPTVFHETQARGLQVGATEISID